MSEVFEVEVEPGTSIDDAATELCMAARAYGRAKMNFNDTPLEAGFATAVSDVLAEWDEVQRALSLQREEAEQREIEELRRLRAFLDFVETWVSNPVGAYSVSALDGLFGMTRDKIASIRTLTSTNGPKT